MPWFYFDIIEGDRIHRDDQGEACPDREAAEAEAVNTAADFVRHGLGKLPRMERSIEVRDEAGQRIVCVRVAVTLDVRRLK
jgi:hypothetical protein